MAALLGLLKHSWVLGNDTKSLLITGRKWALRRAPYPLLQKPADLQPSVILLFVEPASVFVRNVR